MRFRFEERVVGVWLAIDKRTPTARAKANIEDHFNRLVDYVTRKDMEVELEKELPKHSLNIWICFLALSDKLGKLNFLYENGLLEVRGF